MYRQDFCESCNQKHNCQDAYRQLGKAKGPSVVLKIVLAFLLPIVVFVASLAAIEQILAKVLCAKGPQTALSFLLALGVTAVCVLVIRALNRQKSKNK